MKRQLKNILVFTFLVLTVPLAASLLFGFWTEEDFMLFYPNARSLFIICYVFKSPILKRTFKPCGKLEYWIAFTAFYFSSFYIWGLISIILF